jgi:hypothetical protein
LALTLIHKVLSLIQKHQLKTLLMGGQACVLYGAAEFSKDFDFILLVEAENLGRFEKFLSEINAEVIAVPPFEIKYLQKGHAVHFRAGAPGLEQVRIDIMTTLPGVDPFPALWDRRSSAELLPGLSVEILALPDLVKAKKTQRDKDWPMIRRLVDVDYIQNRKNADEKKAVFWLQELRSAAFLIECAQNWPGVATKVKGLREEVLGSVITKDSGAIELALSNEEALIRAEDRRYWAPLRKELEELRRQKLKAKNSTN